MKMYCDEYISQIIESKRESFSDTEKKIADFFIHNSEKTDFSAKAIAERLYVSNASLSRFAKKCGYRGYREFIYHYEELCSRKQRNATSGVRMILNIYQDFLNRFNDLIDENQIVKVVKYINSAEQVYVFGKGSSGLVASEMEFRFMRVGVNIDSIEDPDRMRMQTVFIKEHNLVFGISISGTTADVLYGLKEAHLRGAKTVLLTMKDDESFYAYCDEVLLLPNIGGLDRGNLISPQLPVLVMIDVLYFCFLKKDQTFKENLHNETVWSINKNNLSES